MERENVKEHYFIADIATFKKFKVSEYTIPFFNIIKKGKILYEHFQFYFTPVIFLMAVIFFIILIRATYECNRISLNTCTLFSK